MIKSIAIIVLALPLIACASIDEQAQDACASRGLIPRSAAFADCFDRTRSAMLSIETAALQSFGDSVKAYGEARAPKLDAITCTGNASSFSCFGVTP